MERGDLLAANAGIFGPQGAALNAVAADDVQRRRGRQPGQHERPDRRGIRPRHPLRSVHRPDASRPQPGGRTADRGARRATRRDRRRRDLGQPLGDPVPRRLARDRARGARHRRARRAIRRARAGHAWLDDTFIPRVAKRGAEIIEVRGSSSVASAANAAIEHVRDAQHGTGGAWTSAAVVSRGEYGVPEGLVCSFPVTSDGSGYRVVEGLSLDDRSRARFDASVAELEAERAAVRDSGRRSSRWSRSSSPSSGSSSSR